MVCAGAGTDHPHVVGLIGCIIYVGETRDLFFLLEKAGKGEISGGVCLYARAFER
jgi:hypothetical protein